MQDQIQTVRDRIIDMEHELEVMRQSLLDYITVEELMNAPQGDVSDMFIIWKQANVAWANLSLASKALKRHVGTREAKPLKEKIDA